MASPRTYDRVRSFGGGTDQFRPASEIGPDQSQLMENILVRDNYEARVRFGADQIDSAPASFAAAVNPSGAVQGMAFYNTPTKTLLVLAEGGKLYTWNGVTWAGPLAFTLSSANVMVAFEQGVDKLFISDGVKNPQIFDGTNFADSGGAGQLNAPVGASILCYSAGRMMASGLAAYPDTVFVSNLLNFGPGQWNSATQSFRIGDGDGEAIVALVRLQNFNVAVLKENSVWLMNMDPSLPIANWQAQPQGDLVGAGIGCVGRRAWCQYQNDVLFMSQDGVQSLQRMQAAAGQYQLTSPLSLPLQPYIDRINWSMAYIIQAVKYRHLAIFFVPLDTSAYNNYALVWNGRLGQWTGVFTGWNTESAVVTRFGKITQLVLGNQDGSVNRWKDDPTLINETSTYLDNGQAIPAKLWLRAMVFGNPDAQKKLRAALLRFNAGEADINFYGTLDLADEDDWGSELAPAGDTLPAILPLQLESFKPMAVYRSLEGLPYCNEFFLKVESATGWWALRNVMVSAFTKPIRDPSA